MRKTLNNKLLMFWAVLSVLSKFKQVWSNIPGFVAIQKKFNSTVETIQKTSQVSDVKTTEITKGKNQALTKYIELLFKITSMVSVYASENNMAELKSKVDYTEGELKDMRPGEILAISEEVLAIIASHKKGLTLLGFKAEDEKEMKEFVDNFEAITLVTRATITSRKTAGGLIKPQFAAASFILKEKLDGLMEQFRVSNPEFYNEYWNARETVKYGVRHEKVEEKSKETSK